MVKDFLGTYLDLIDNDVIKPHHTYSQTGICVGSLKQVSGVVNLKDMTCYIDPKHGEIDVCKGNKHFGYAHFEKSDDVLKIVDNNNRAEFILC